MRKIGTLTLVVFCLTPAASAGEESPTPHIDIERSIDRAVAHEIATQITRGDQRPPPPRDLIPQLPDHCSVRKGIAIGAAVGGGAGTVFGAVAGDSFGPYVALVVGAIGAGGGAIAGWLHCR